MPRQNKGRIYAGTKPGKAKAFSALYESSQSSSWLDSALLCYRLISQVEDLLYSGYYGESSKLLHAANSHQRAADAIRLAYQLFQIRQDDRYAEQAYFFMEHSKAAFLKEIFQEVDAQTLVNVPDSIFEKEKSLVQTVKQNVCSWSSKSRMRKEFPVTSVRLICGG